jgi:hypothetical protein
MKFVEIQTKVLKLRGTVFHQFLVNTLKKIISLQMADHFTLPHEHLFAHV